MSRAKRIFALVMVGLTCMGVFSSLIFNKDVYADDPGRIRVTYKFEVGGQDTYKEAVKKILDKSSSMNAGTLTQSGKSYKASSGNVKFSVKEGVLTATGKNGFWGSSVKNIASKLNTVTCKEEKGLSATVTLPGNLSATSDAVKKGLTSAGAKYVCTAGATTAQQFEAFRITPVFTTKTSGTDMLANETGNEEGEEGEGNTEGTCMNSGGAKSLGWVVCPIMDWVHEALEKFYNEYVDPALQVEPKLFTDGGGDSTYDGWNMFRNLANILMVILFLVVIFSQVTGVGINNYGIKQILPKLILAAILMNLSYWICIIFIDISNIFGNGMQEMFQGLADGLSDPVVSTGGDKIADVDLEGHLISIGAITGLFAGGAIVWTNPAVVLTLLISALGVLVSIFFLFILLAAREAAIVVMVVLSSMAVACMMLPNTKSWFDKWWKFFGSLLMVYPIAGVLIGGGNYVSRLLLSTGETGPFWTFTAVLAGIVPIFFIPTVLRSSLSMAGNLGARISGVGQRVGGGVQRMATNSGINKNAQQWGAERQTRIRGGIDRNGNPVTGARRRFANVLSGGNRMRQRNALQYQKMVADRGALEAADAPEFMLATETANVAKALSASGELNNMGRMDSDSRGGSGLTGGLYSALMDDNKAKIRAYTDALSAKGEEGRKSVKAAFNAALSNGADDDALRAFSDNIMQNHGADYKNNDRSMFAVAQGISSAERKDASGNTVALGAERQTTMQYLAGGGQAELASKVTANTIGNMDDEAFKETFGTGGSLHIPERAGETEDEKKERMEAIGATAYAALNDQNANIKGQRRADLEGLVAQSGYTSKTQQQAQNVSSQLNSINQNLSNLQPQTQMPQQAGPQPLNGGWPQGGGNSGGGQGITSGGVDIPH